MEVVIIDKINVDLYEGTGRRENPLEANIIYCDKHNECTFYKENKCLRCCSFLAPSCKFGRNSIIKGYTSRAKKYYDFKNHYTSDEVYGKLHYPSNLVAVIGDTLYINLKYVRVRKRKEGDEKWKKDIEGYIMYDAGISCGGTFIPVADATNTLLHAIFSYEPHGIMGGIITSYKEKIVPDIIQDLKKAAPLIHEKFISEYPEYDVAPNYVGKCAYIKTMTEGSKLRDCHGDDYILHDGKLYCDNMTKGFIPFSGKSANIIVTVKDDTTYQVTSNDQCNENTRFK